MLGAASLLTLVTLGGLLAGFAREWLMVASWGASARTDAYVLAMFLPEALRAMLAAGVFTSSALALWQARSPGERQRWFAHINLALLLSSLLLTVLLSLGAPAWVHLLAPGLAEAQREDTQRSLAVLAWCVPGIVLQAWWAMPRQAAGHFLLAAFASLAYNLPALAYLAAKRAQAQPSSLSWCFVLGSLASALLLLPSAWRSGLAHTAWRGMGAAVRSWLAQLSPLLGSAVLGQGIALLERIVASYLGEGAVTAIHLARKLMNLPLIALQSLNQVLLSLMSRRLAQRLSLLRQGLRAVTLVSLPAALGLMLSAPALTAWLFPRAHGAQALSPLLAGYAAILVLASWNTLLARYHYAEGDTRGPLQAEVKGCVLQALCLPALAAWCGPQGIVWALMAGTALTAHALLRAPSLRAGVGLSSQFVVVAATLSVAWWGLRPWLSFEPFVLFAQAAGLGLLCLLALALWLRPWQIGASATNAAPT